MPITTQTIYRSRADILGSMLGELTGAIPDAYTGEDGTIRIIFDIESGQFENVFMSLQLLLEDMFITTASYQALIRYGDQYGLPMKAGTRSTGTLRLSGDDGTFVPIGSLVASDPGNGVDPVLFETVAATTIPTTGIPNAPSAIDAGTAGNLNGGYEYVVTYLTATGETLPSAESNLISVVNKQVTVNGVNVGGPQVIGRRVYRDKNGAGDYRLVRQFNEVTTISFTDNATDASIAGAQTLPTTDTAHQALVAGSSLEIGIDGNVAVGTITTLSDVPGGLTDVTNTTIFTGGSDPEDIEQFRGRLLDFIQNPQTGSPSDIQAWAEGVPGVGTASVAENVPSPGHVTVTITGPDGSVPTSDTLTAVQTTLDALDYANITIHVTSFTALPTNVTVDVTAGAGYSLGSVTPSVQAAISDYITGLQAGETLKISGIIDSVFGLNGVDDVVVTTPSSNQTTPTNQKRTAGTITVT